MLDIDKISQSCVKCAKCVPSCTIYQIHRDEVTSPRGFIDLLGAQNRGQIALDSNLKNIFESCFLCTTCTTLCPQNIDTATMIISSRIEIARTHGILWFKRVYFFLLKRRKLMDFVFSITHFLAPCAFRIENDRARSRFALSKLGKRTIFPFARKSFLNAHKDLGFKDSRESRESGRESRESVLESKRESESSNRESSGESLNFESHESSGDLRPKVAIFIGCLGNYNYTQIGESLLFILEKLGIRAILPPQECCGAPAFFTGDIDSVIHLVTKNIAQFERFFAQIDALIIPEATCAAMILKDWKHAIDFSNLRDKAAWHARLDALLPKIFMASDYLFKHTNLPKILESAPKSRAKITYHDPCHAKKVLGIASEPRALIAKNYDIVEMRECDRCCGFGGVTMQSQKYEFSARAGAPKAQHIADSGADFVSAECSACRMQLNNAMDNARVKTPFFHPLELICEALKGADSRLDSALDSRGFADSRADSR